MTLVSVVTDLHLWHKPLRSRTNFPKECVDLFNRLLAEIKSVRVSNPGEKYYVVLGGDLFHKEISSGTDAVQWYQRFSILRSFCDGIFLVIGNHEITWAPDNVFWTLVNDSSDSALPVGVNFAKGLIPIATLNSHLDIEDIRLHFVHYRGKVNELGTGRNIAFVHDDYFCENIIDAIQDINDVDLVTQYTGYHKITESSILSKFNAIFFFHNHKAIGTFDVEFDHGNTCRMYHLGSLGRTSKDQVFDTKPVRTVPLIRINNGSFTVEQRKIDLPQAKDIIDVKKVEKSSLQYERQKERKKLRETVIDGLDPVSSIETELNETPEALEFFKLAKSGNLPDWYRRLL